MIADSETFDQAYVQRLLAGDPQVHQHFTAHFGQLLNIKLRRRVASADAVDDLRQETFTRVLQAIKSGGLNDPARLGGFVHAVCRNVLHEFWRGEVQRPVVNDEGQLNSIASGRNLEDDLVTKERREWVRSMLASLPAKDREILRLIFIEERERDEVCAECKVDRGYLRVLVHRATTRLRRRYQGEWRASLFFL